MIPYPFYQQVVVEAVASTADQQTIRRGTVPRVEEGVVVVEALASTVGQQSIRRGTVLMEEAEVVVEAVSYIYGLHQYI